MPKSKPLLNVSDYYSKEDFGNELLLKHGFPNPVGTFEFECTVTFNQRIHTRASALASQQKIIQKLISWHPDVFETIVMVIEYQKNGMPHYHMLLTSEVDIDAESRYDTVKGFERAFGMTTFKPVIESEKFVEYLSKDVINNNIKFKFPHCYEYNKK